MQQLERLKHIIMLIAAQLVSSVSFAEGKIILRTLLAIVEEIDKNPHLVEDELAAKIEIFLIRELKREQK